MTDLNIELARFNMAEQQIRPWDVTDPKVLDIIQSIPRENFIPHAYKGLAFADTEIPIGEGQHMMKPKVEARMLQALSIRPNDQILEIGTGSGFITACLAKLADHVVSYEIHASLTEQARKNLALAGISNVRLHTADPLAVRSSTIAYDVIAITGSLPEYDDGLQQMLTPGGRMFVVTGQPPVMEAMLITRDADNEFQQKALFETELQALEGVPEKNRFVF